MERKTQIEIFDLTEACLTPYPEELTPQRNYSSLIYSLVFLGYDPEFNKQEQTVSIDGPCSNSKIRSVKTYWDINTGRIVKTEVYRNGKLNHSNSYEYNEDGRLVTNNSQAYRDGKEIRNTITKYYYPSLDVFDSYLISTNYNNEGQKITTSRKKYLNESLLLPIS